MGILDKAGWLADIIRWRVRWDRRDLEYKPEGVAPGRFVTGREAAARIPDEATVLSCGMAGNARCSAFFWAVAEHHASHGRPRGLTWISVGAQGGRGKAPGTVEELGRVGLLRRYVSGHVETAKSLLALAQAGELDIHVLPQGEMALLIDGQSEGRETILSRTAVGTFLDPRCGDGSPVVCRDDVQLIHAHGDQLEYRMPLIDCALLSASCADRHGNVYLTDMATLTETREAVRAARHNGGLVMAVVADLVEPDPSAPLLPAEQVDAIVVNPWNEQTVMARQRQPWRLFCPGGDGDDHRAIEKLRFINRMLHITPTRGAVDLALGRLGATVFAEAAPHDAHINIGVGFPEEVCRELYESGLKDHLTFTTETGVFGGLPTPGIYFGAAVNPQRFESSAWMFRHYQERLDAAVLGFLEVDSRGNVNASRRGASVTDYVGPGGFPTIVECARAVFFIGTWMAGARWALSDGQLKLRKPGRPKFVDKVSEITFNGRRALGDGKQVFYVTNIGVLRLAEEGLIVDRLMPGIDIERDVLANTTARIHVPDQVPRVPQAVLTGRGFELHWSGTA